MTSLQNGNYNSRSMNGLTTIYANDITSDVVNTIDANVSNNLNVGGTITQTLGSGTNQLKSTNINANLDVTGNTNISGNLVVAGTSDLLGNTVIGIPSFSLSFGRNTGVQALGDATYSAYTQGTIEVWYKNRDIVNNNQFIFGVQNSFLLLLTSGNRLATFNYGVGAGARNTSILITDGAWHHLALVFNLGITNGTKIYYDGLPVLTTTISASTPGLSFFANSTTAAGTAIQGLIDEPRIWSVMRTDAEILANYKIQLPPTTPGLTGYWLLEEGTGTIVSNAVSGGPIFTNTGGTWVYGRLSANLNTTGDLKANNLNLGTATYNIATQFKMNGVMNIGDRVNDNTISRVLNVRDTNGIISIGRYSASEPGFELRNYDPVTGALRTDVLFLGGGASEQIRCLFRSPGLGGDVVSWFGYRNLFDYKTPTQTEPGVAQTGTQYTARFRDRFISNNLDIVLNPTAGNFSSIVQAGDNTIAVSQPGRSLTLTTSNGSGCGIRMNTEITVGGNTTFTSGSNINQSGSGIIDQSGSGTNNMKAISLNGNDDFTQSGSGIISQAGSGTNALKQTLITGAFPIEIIPETPPSGSVNTKNAILVLKNNPYSAGMILEQTAFGNLLSYGINEIQFGTRTTATRGGFFRIDTRPGEALFSVISRAAGSTTQVSPFGIMENETAYFNGTLSTVAISMAANYNLTQSGTGIISQAGSGTNLLKDTSITGVLGITGYSDVKTTLDTLTTSSTATTGITYTAGTDTTQIDNNITITNNKTLTLQDTTIQKTAFRPDVLNECEINFLVNVGISLDPVLFATFNLGEQPSALVGPGANIYFFTAIKLVKNEVYKGIGLYIGTVGNWECALYPRGSNGSRIAITAITASVANRMNYFNFSGGTYTHTGDTDIFYIAYRTTSASQTNLYAPINTFLNYNNTTGFNGILNKRCQTASSGAASFPASLAGVGTMAANSYLPYAILYGPEPPPAP